MTCLLVPLMLASSLASGAGTPKANASLDFKIVIPAAVHLQVRNGQVQVKGNLRGWKVQREALADGRQLYTLSQP